MKKMRRRDAMNRWCNLYGCWCSDVEEILEDLPDCNFECEDCEESEEIKPVR